ncbi:MAG: protoporphyrinogen oxidase, partial [Pirellulales bacterium]
MGRPVATTPLKVAVVGGGITGLAAAHRLVEQSARTDREVQLVLFEAAPRIGGPIATHQRDGYLVEAGAYSFITEKPWAVDLARRLGLEARLIGTEQRYRRSFVVRQGRLVPVPEGYALLAPARLLPVLRSPLFTWRGKLRMAMDLVLPRGAADGDESLAQFVTRRLGPEVLERLAQPLVGGIYTADPRKLSLRATMPRFLEMERRHRSLIRALARNRRRQDAEPSGARYGLFASFDKGMQVLTTVLAGRLRPGTIRLESSVAKLEPFGLSGQPDRESDGPRPSA